MRSKRFIEAMKVEAVKRMKQLKISDEAFTAFESENKLLCSYYVLQKEVPSEILKEIQDWEKKFGCIAYHVIYSKLYGYEIYNALSVSNYIEDWDYENALIADNRSMAYTINITKPDYSESGSIVLDNNRGILQRII